VYPTPEEAAEHTYTPHERQLLRHWQASHVVGDPAEVGGGLTDLAARFGADELTS
jgi:hypothetical protein